MSSAILRPIMLSPELGDRPAPFDLFDERGNLLLRQGLTLGASIFTSATRRRFYCRAESAAPSSTPTPPRTLQDAGEALAVLERLVVSDHSPTADTFIDLAEQYHAAWRFDPDACIGLARLARPVSPAIGQLMLAALFAAEIGDAHGLPQQAVSHLVGAALTMNLGSLALHDQMYAHREAPDEHARAALVRHPLQAAKLLARLGPLPDQWLRAVAEHHENIDGSGYPRSLQRSEISLGGRILRVADVFAARLLGRRGRGPHFWNLAKTGTHDQLLEHVFGRDLRQVDHHLARLLVRRLGRFPPGSLVRLSNGELAMVCRRHGTTQPREALALLAPDGRRHAQPLRRLFADTDLRILGYAHDDQLRLLPEYDWALLWGYSPRPQCGSGRLH
ncbi:hypothetical protein B4966_03945 [Rhodocyclaceae bacterium]|jgi:hypothetical protein|nr:hypothetical protein B4966_03945 [Rhodocyclaceae bacterium]